jgi:leucyl-tRNA synthetase
VPHICEELWQMLGEPASTLQQDWPEWDAEAATFDTIEMPVQINGTVRERITVERGAEEDAVREQTLALEGIQSRLEGREVKRVIVVPDRIVNIVAG